MGNPESYSYIFWMQSRVMEVSMGKNGLWV